MSGRLVVVYEHAEPETRSVPPYLSGFSGEGACKQRIVAHVVSWSAWFASYPSLASRRLRSVPRIASFDGLVLKVFFNDHPPPHVHVYAGRVGRPGVQAARISIETGEVIAGQLAPAKVTVVRNWCDRHRESLYADWQRAQHGLHPAGRYDK